MSPAARTVFAFSEPTFIENITVRPNGHLLLTTFREGSLFDLDPNDSKPEAHLVAGFPGVKALTGIVQIEADVYAVTGANHSRPKRFVAGSCTVFTFDLRNGIDKVVVETIMKINDAEVLNGMANIPDNPHILLSVDSVPGRIWRINLQTKKVDVVLQHELLAWDETSVKVDLGINGAKFRDGYLYFTNSNREIFGRIPVSSEGSVTGEIEILKQNKDAEEDFPYDDFAFDPAGNAYIGTHSDRVFRVGVDGKQELLVGGDDTDLIQSPTSTAVSNDGKKLYVACAGKVGDFIGKVVEVEL